MSGALGWGGRVIRERILALLLEGCPRAGRLVRRKCSVIDGHEYCVYRYKTADYRPFYEHPCLGYARGSVVIDESILILPFTKFFNVDEVPETRRERLPARPLHTFEKLDGSLLVAWRDPLTGEVRFNTRGLLWNMAPGGKIGEGVLNPHVAAALEFIREQGQREQLETLVGDTSVVMFEAVVPGVPASSLHARQPLESLPGRVELYLLARRDMRDLRLIPPREGDWPLMPRRFDFDLDSLLRASVSFEGEGVVAWYDRLEYSGDMSMLDPLVKFKSRTYLLEVTGLQSKRAALAYAFEKGVDDIVSTSILTPEEVDALRQAVELHAELQRLVNALHPHAKEAAAHGLRGWILQAVEKPDQLTALVIANGPRSPVKMVGFLRRTISRLKRVAERLGLQA